MEFGRIEAELLDTADFLLPADTIRTTEVLKQNKNKGKTNVYVGCAKWGRKDWVGKIYPKGTKDKDFLEAYGRQFNCIEFNAIFYKLPSHEQVREWKSKAGKNFLFCPKFTDVITHKKRLKNAKHEVDLLLDVLHEFDDQLGPIFLMPHPQMGPKQSNTIKDFLNELPKDINVFLELRHPDWFVNQGYTELFDFCQENNFGTVITDTAGRRDCVHMELTKPEAFIRFVGNSLHESDYKRIDDWVTRIGQWIDKGINDVYFFMHQHDELYSPELVKYLIDELNAKHKLGIKAPQFYEEQSGKLF
jgi:uncharacterized protein YecE (DUF72 family)